MRVRGSPSPTALILSPARFFRWAREHAPGILHWPCVADIFDYFEINRKAVSKNLVLPAATAAPGRIALTPVSRVPVPGAAAIGPAVVPGKGAEIVAPARLAVFMPSGASVLMAGRSFRSLVLGVTAGRAVVAAAAVTEGAVMAVALVRASAEAFVPVSVLLPVTEVPVRFFRASRASRQAVAAGRSIDDMVPPAVAAYIREKNLYREGDGTHGNDRGE